jgi:hypothetical protein
MCITGVIGSKGPRDGILLKIDIAVVLMPRSTSALRCFFLYTWSAFGVFVISD